MRSSSSGFVAARFLDREAVIASLRRVAEKLRRERPAVESVILFGSLARGDYGLRSDADVLIVVADDSRKRRADRIPEFLRPFLDADVPVDVFPLTRRELRAEIDAGSVFWRRAIAEGTLLAGQPFVDTASGGEGAPKR